MRVVAVIELDHGRVARQRDYWDGRALPASALAGLRASYPATCARPGWRASNARRAVRRWPGRPALSAPRSKRGRASPRCSPTTPCSKTQPVGVLVRTGDAVAAHLAHWSAALPYGHGATETNIVGGTGGGAWEWIPSPPFAQTVGAGATAVPLAPDGRIAELIVGWDTSRLSSRERLALPEGDDRR